MLLFFLYINQAYISLRLKDGGTPVNVFSALSIIACVIYLFVGVYAYNLERKSSINRLFLVFCLSMSIWSFAYAFVYVTEEEQYIWMKISAIGWCTFSSLILHLVLLLTENHYINNKYVKISLYIPSVMFFYISVFLFRKDSKPSEFIEKFFYTGDFLYHFCFLLASIILIAIWGRRSNSIRRRKQTKIIIASSLTPFLLNLLTQNIMPLLGITILPLMGHIYSLVMLIGTYYAMIKYRLMEITPKLLVEELLQEMVEVAILASPEGRIIKVNESTEKLLGYSHSELTSMSLDSIIDEWSVMNTVLTRQDTTIHKFAEVFCKGKDGSRTALSMTCSLIIDPSIKDVLGMVVVGHDISLVKALEKKIDEHKKAEEKIRYMAYHDTLTGLPNRKYFYELLNRRIKDAKKSGEMFAVLFLDVDGLKIINDSYGHETGDFLICEVGRRASASIEETDLAARIGGDEFTFLIFGIYSAKDADDIAKKLMFSINKPLQIHGADIAISASIGASVFPQDGVDADLLVKMADNRMYKVKRDKIAVNHY